MPASRRSTKQSRRFWKVTGTRQIIDGPWLEQRWDQVPKLESPTSRSTAHASIRGHSWPSGSGSPTYALPRRTECRVRKLSSVNARAAAWLRLVTPSLRNTAFRWVRTVFSLTDSASAMARFESPDATSAKTSLSRALRPQLDPGHCALAPPRKPPVSTTWPWATASREPTRSSAERVLAIRPRAPTL